MHASKFVPDCYKTQKMHDKAVNGYPSKVQFVPECYKTQEICNRAANIWFFVFDSIHDWYKIQEMYDRVIYKDPFMVYIALIDIKLKKCWWLSGSIRIYSWLVCYK